MTDLTATEQDNVRVALRYFRREYGGWKMIAKMLGFELDTVSKVSRGGRNVTGGMAVRVARVAGVSVESLLSGEYPPSGTCPKCGYRARAVAKTNATEQGGRTDLLSDEQAHVRVALRYLWRRTGNWGTVAKGVGYERDTLDNVVNASGTVTGSMAIRTARLAGVPADDLLAGKFPPAGTCPQCGRTAR